MNTPQADFSGGAGITARLATHAATLRYEDLPPALAARTFSTVFHTPVLRNRHGDASGVRGAAWLWKD